MAPKALPVEFQTCQRCGLCNQFGVGIGARCWPEAVCGGEPRHTAAHCRCAFTWQPALSVVHAVADYYGVEPSSTLRAVWDPQLPPDRVRNGCRFDLDEDRFVDRRMAGHLSRPREGEMLSWSQVGGQPPEAEIADGATWYATVHSWGIFYRNHPTVRTGPDAFKREPWAVDSADGKLGSLMEAAGWVTDRAAPVLFP